MKKFFFRTFAFLLIFFLALEAFLWLTHKLYQDQYLKQIGLSDLKNHIGPVIVTLGESTTTDVSAYPPWPRQLEKKLKDLDIPVRVVNLAEPGTNSTLQLKRLLDIKQALKNPIIISMLGINEEAHLSNPFILKESIVNRPFFKSIELMIRYYRYFFDSDKTIELITYESLKDTFLDPRRPEIRTYFKSLKKHIDTVETVKNYLLQNKIDLTEGYWLAAQTFNFETQEPEEARKLAFLFAVEAFNTAYDIKMGPLLSSLSLYSQNHQQCEALAIKIIEETKVIDNLTLRSLADCLQPHHPLILKIFQRTGLFISIAQNKNQETLKINYHHIYKTATEVDGCLMAMQYPRIDIENLKNIFLEEPLKKIVLIENKDNFNTQLKHLRYEDLFLDRLRPLFGHTTELGHALIADNVLQTLLKLKTTHPCYSF